MRLSCVVSQYLLGNLREPQYFLLRMLLSYDMNQVCLVVGFLKYTNALKESFTSRDSHHSLWLKLLSYDMNRRYR